jgi:homopolymeric O-antigen transport system permease protein
VRTLESTTNIANPPPSERADEPVRIIEPASGWRFPDFRELWEHRDLFYMMVRRDISARYRQSVFGASWAILEPVLLAIVFSIFLGQYANVPSVPGIPYGLLAVSGMVIWLFISASIENASLSTISSSALISRVYFPRLVIPLAAVVPPLIDFCIAFVVVIGAMLIYGVTPSTHIVLLPVVILVALTTIVGIGLWLSALNVRYRDIQQAVPFVLLLSFFITPIIYPITQIPAAVKPFYSLNPAVGILEGYRWTLFSGYDFPGAVLLVPLVASVVLVVTGLLYFERTENSFADVI